MSAQPRTTNEPSPCVPWLVYVFQIVATMACCGLTAYLVGGNWRGWP